MNSLRLTRIGLAVTFWITVIASCQTFAQVDMSGLWAARNHEDSLERGPGPYAVDYTALPLNDDARAKALSYSQ